VDLRTGVGVLVKGESLVPAVDRTLERPNYSHRICIQQFYVLPTECIYVFCVDLRTNSDYFTVQH